MERRIQLLSFFDFFFFSGFVVKGFFFFFFFFFGGLENSILVLESYGFWGFR